MRTPTTLTVVMLLGACFVPLDEHVLGGNDAGVNDAGVRCLRLTPYPDGVVCATLSPVVCGGRACGTGEVCCQTTGACVAPGSPACPKPPTSAGGMTACGSSADCGPDQYCVPDVEAPIAGGFQYQRCIGGSGHCQLITNCAWCGGGRDRCEVCGCNGVTYESPQAACVSGVWAFNHGACGRTQGQDGGAFTVACGTDAQCPSGAQCCFRTGKCFDAAEPWRCAVQPDGTILDCASHGECDLGAGGGSGTEAPTRLCAGTGCNAPGLCGTRRSSDCGGDLQSVCGCDGLTYVNACWARAAGQRVVSVGDCP